jgi:transcriptional regulator NrdR family protein
MKCREFEAIVVDLARGRGIDDASVRHAESCRKCAARLAAEREVTNALSALAQSARDCGAPERVERALVAAFANRPVGRQPVSPFRRGGVWRRPG